MPAATNGPFDLATSPIHIGTRASAVQANFGFDGPAFETYVKSHSTENDPGRLVMIEASPENWSAWECHHEGDELVIVLEGSGVLRQQLDTGEVSIAFKAGDTLINPQDVWHTADVIEPMRAIYLTPCRGTEHKPR